MKEELIQLTKKKGFVSLFPFEEPVYSYSHEDGLKWLFWMGGLQKWLRETHNLHLSVWYNILTEKYRTDSSNTDLDNALLNSGEYVTYELALEKGLITALQFINLNK